MRIKKIRAAAALAIAGAIMLKAAWAPVCVYAGEVVPRVNPAAGTADMPGAGNAASSVVGQGTAGAGTLNGNAAAGTAAAAVTDMQQVVPPAVNIVNGELEQVLDEDKEAVVPKTTRRVYPKWQGERTSAAKTHDYYIKVNKKTNTVTVYKKEENGKLTPYKAMVCSIGRAGHDTPEGKGYKTTDYYDWRLMVDNTYGRYAVRFNGSIMFHSVPYYESKKDSLEWQDYNKLGSPASLGCIRLAVADAKWIFDNCRRGTEVDVYSGPASTDPLGTPEPIKLDTSSKYRDWDPTDLTPENPWLVPVE